MKKQLLLPLTWTLPMLGLLVGCGKDPDDRIAEMANRSLDAQARQNDRLAQQTEHVVEASKELVVADARARMELAELQRDLQADQREVGRQRDALEVERRKIAMERYSEQLISSAITTVGLLLLGALPIVLGIYLLRAVHRSDAADPVLTEVLVNELVGDRPQLLGRPTPLVLESPRQPPPNTEETTDWDDDATDQLF